MREIEVTVPFQEGLHARPAVKLVKLAGTLDASAVLVKGGEEYSAGSITAVLSAGIKCGDKITLRVEGPGEDAAAAALKAYFA